MDYFSNRKAVAQVRENIGDPTGKLSDDNGWSSHMVLDRLYDTRADVIRQKMQIRESVNPQNIQVHPCIKLVRADKHDCPCAPPTGCVWMRTEVAVPSFISMLSVTSIDGSIKYDYVQWSRAAYVLNSFMPQERKKAYYTQKMHKDGIYFYLINDEHKRYITPVGIFSDPRQVQLARDCKGNKPLCPRVLDLQFVIDPDIKDMVFSRVTNTLKIGRANTAPDVRGNDAEDWASPILR